MVQTAQADVEGLTYFIAAKNPQVRQALLSVIKELEPEKIVESDNLDEALLRLRQKTPDIIVTTWGLSDLNGLKLAHYLRHAADSPCRYASIILVAPFKTREQLTKARDVGVTEVVAYPFSAKIFKHRVAEIINHPRPFITCGKYFGPDRRRKDDPNYEGPERRNTGEMSEERIKELLKKKPKNED